ncbi:hypothetical protein [Formosa sp. S-31]|uniref:hypothetical protein n=1 Tax=Formosa sp. S-31 TaxID=2790949 RepID=UPI003EB9C2E5
MSLFKVNIIYFVLCLFLSCSSNNDNSEDQTEKDLWLFEAKTLGGSKNDSGKAVVSTSDGGYIISGYTQSNDGDISTKTDDSFDVWVLKFNANDKLEWSKTYGGTGDDRAEDIIQNNDGSFSVLGYSQSQDGDLTENAGLKDFWILNIDAKGELIWQKSIGYPGNDYGIALTATSDQGLLLTGVIDVTASGGAGNTKTNRHAGGDYWAIKLNSQGDILWRHYFGGTYTDTPYDVIETPDHNFIIAGSSDSFDVDISNNHGSYDFWVVKISNSGELLWEKNFGGSQIDEAYSLTSTSDGSIYIAGDSWSEDQDISTPKGASDIWLLKISSDGVLLWEKSFGGSQFDAARHIFTTQDQGLLITGSSRSSDGDLTINHGQNDVCILKLDASGNLKTLNTTGGSGVDFAYSITQLNNGKIVCIGDSTSADIDIPENKGYSDLLILTH